jgi:hypothetical protein
MYRKIFFGRPEKNFCGRQKMFAGGGLPINIFDAQFLVFLVVTPSNFWSAPKNVCGEHFFVCGSPPPKIQKHRP